MNNKRRLEIYLRAVRHKIDDNGFYRLTPKQRRRAVHKQHREIKYVSEVWIPEGTQEASPSISEPHST